MTERLRPLFSYFGSKWKLAPRYPAPRHGLIVEPFAGSACYSLLYADRDVLLIDANRDIVDTWRYLIEASPSEIRDLPDLPESGVVADLDLPRGPELLIRWWVNSANAYPPRRTSTWAKKYPDRFWCQKIRDRVASGVSRISHWRVCLGDYRQSPTGSATVFVDPPYRGRAGRYYGRFGSSGIDYSDLGQWCRSIEGQAIVCEMEGASWLPFETFATVATTSTSDGTRRSCKEVVWLNEHPDQLSFLFEAGQ